MIGYDVHAIYFVAYRITLSSFMFNYSLLLLIAVTVFSGCRTDPVVPTNATNSTITTNATVPHGGKAPVVVHRPSNSPKRIVAQDGEIHAGGPVARGDEVHVGGAVARGNESYSHVAMDPIKVTIDPISFTMDPIKVAPTQPNKPHPVRDERRKDRLV